MKNYFTLKWLVALFLISVFSLVTDNITSNLTPSTKRGNDAERAIQFCPAYPGLIKAKNPDGTSISFYLRGDEVLHWQVTPDGYTLLENEKGYYCYATQDAKGNLIPSSVVATDTKSKSGLSIPKNLAFSKSQISEALKTRDELFQPIASVKTTGSKTKGFTMGTRKVLVLLIDFKDRPFAHSRQEYDDMMNMPGYDGTGSFRDYYKAVSYNQLICETTVKGPYHASGTMAKYGSNINGNKYINAKLLVQEAVDAAELDGVNFADYDNDGDGYVDAVIVVHSNNDEAQGAGSNALWSHQSALRYSGMQRSYDGVTVDVYNIDPGVTGATGDAMATIGVYCHEFGHALGLPDTYDIDYSGALTPGNWDIMDGGGYNNGSRTPAYHNPWARTKLGWQTPVVKSNPETGLTLADCSTSQDLFRVNTQTIGEYYILENRQQTGYNQYVYGHGLLIWRIDSTYISTAGNGVNTDPTHQGVALVRANGVASNSGANTFPGTANITSFTDETTPSMKSYDGRRVYKPISNIQEATGTISFDFVQGLPAADAGIIAVIYPKSSLFNAGAVNVTAKIKNFGSAAISNFPVLYKFDAEVPVSETFTNTIEPGAEAEYTFATQLNIPVGDHTIEIYTAVVGDAIAENDKTIKSLGIFSSVLTLPLSEDFEGTFPPTSWKVLNPDVPAGTWVQKTSIGITGISTKSAFIDYWNYGGTKDYLLTPAIDLKGTSAPALTFNYAYHKTASDGLAIQVSTDFGETYSTVWQKSGVDLATVPSDALYNDFTPASGDQWKTISIELDQFIGKEVIISFTGISANGDNIYIDDVKVVESTCVSPTEAKNFTITNLTKNSGTINWVRGNGVGVIVLQRMSQNVDGVPQNSTAYNVGDMIGSSKVIFVGDATNKSLTGLIPATTYNYAIYEISSTNCYSLSPLNGSITTLGLASVNTVTIRDLQATSATIIGNVTNVGEAPVTERGICYSIDNSTLGVDFDHIACQSGTGEFAASIANLIPGSYYYAVAYAKNMYGITYGNVLTFYTIGGCDELNYTPLGASNFVGTYTDLGTNGTTISVANNDDANSLPVDLGFSFKFNCLSFNKFILNTNGFIKLGETNPSKANLFLSTPTSVKEEGLYSKDNRDMYILAPFNYDLTAGTGTPEYRVYTEGSAPNRITTIQFKNLADKTISTIKNQFTNIEFQIKLYETTNTIEFIYGTWTVSANANQSRYSHIGIKGGGYGSSNIVALYKGSTSNWSSGTFYKANYNSEVWIVNKSYNVTSGRTLRFTSPYLSSDAAILDVYANTNLPSFAGMPQTVSADVKNAGIADMSNVTVNLEVTGSNTYTATPIVIPYIAVGNTIRVAFPAFITNLEGTNTVKVFVAGDDNATNDSKTVTQTISTDTYSYAVGTSFYTSYNAAGVTSVKYHINGSRSVKTVNAYCGSSSAPGKTTKAYVFDASGNKIGESATVTIVAGWNTFAITTPPTVTNSDFYVGIDATPYTSYFLASVQSINAINTGVNVVIPVAGGTPVDFANPFRFMITAVIDVPAVTDKPVVVTNSEVTHPTNTDAVVNGSVTDDKGSPITERGFYWSTATPVTTADTKIISSTIGVGNISETIAGLTVSNTYYVAAFATNINGTTLGNEISFVKKSSQAITFGSLAAMVYEDADIALTATASSSLPISYICDNTNVATIVETPASSGNFFIHVVGVGTCNIKASQAGDGTYGAATDVTQSLVVNKKAVTVTIPNLSRSYNYNPQVVVPTPAIYKYVITYNGSPYAPVDVASYTVVATIDDANFQGTATETLVISKVNSEITFNSIPVKKLSDEDFFPDVMSSSGLDISLASDNLSVATIVGGNIHIVGEGKSKITASSTGNINFNAPESKDQILLVDQTKPVITLTGAASVDITYGSTYTDLGATATDNVDGTITSSIVVTGTVTNTSPVGTYTIQYNVTDEAGNAAIEVTRTVNVLKAPLTITADDQTKVYGTVNPTLTFQYSGFVNGETDAVLTTVPTANTTIDATTVVGVYTGAITVDGGVDENYSFDYVSGDFTITIATATINIANTNQTYDGTAKSVTTATTPTGLTVDVTYDGSTTVPTNAGTYAVVATINDTNYQGTQSGSLTINMASATINITNTTQTYDGTAKSVTTVTTPAGLTVDITYDGSATVPTNVGIYAVIATINDANYQGTQSGTLTIDKATATIEITNTTQTYSGTAKSVTVTTVPANLNFTVTYDGSATEPTNVGNYAVVVTVNDANYEGTQNATLQITPGVGVDPNDLNSIRIYSNTKDIFVEIPLLEGTAQLGIFNILGAQVHSTVNLIQGLNKIEGNFISGTYIIKVVAGKKIYTQKVLLK